MTEDGSRDEPGKSNLMPWLCNGIALVLIALEVLAVYAVGFGAMGRRLLLVEVVVLFTPASIGLLAAAAAPVLRGKQKKRASISLRVVSVVLCVLAGLEVAYVLYIVLSKGVR